MISVAIITGLIAIGLAAWAVRRWHASNRKFERQLEDWIRGK